MEKNLFYSFSKLGMTHGLLSVGVREFEPMHGENGGEEGGKDVRGLPAVPVVPVPQTGVPGRVPRAL